MNRWFLHTPKNRSRYTRINNVNMVSHAQNVHVWSTTTFFDASVCLHLFYLFATTTTMLFFCVCVLSSQGNVHMAISIDFAKKQRANFKCPFAIIVAARTSPPAIITATTITYILATDGRWSPLNAYMLWKCRHRFPYKNAWDAPNASTFPSSHLDADCRDNGHATNRERDREEKKSWTIS